ncbi:hypothetical protein [Leifsonia sp. LS1]|nr:hypothetical protein [Leifsonia sp. LS1]
MTDALRDEAPRTPVRKDNSNDTMLPIEIDTVQNYIAAIKP